MTLPNYFVLGSDIKIRIGQKNCFVYPDIVLICEKPKFYKKRKDTILNPVLVIEILSDGTEEYDRGGKFKLYRSLPSFKEYLLVTQYEPNITSYFFENRAKNLWKISETDKLSQALKLHSIGFDLPLQAVYHRIPKLLGKEWKG